jgi:hypothetical protein
VFTNQRSSLFLILILLIFLWKQEGREAKPWARDMGKLCLNVFYGRRYGLSCKKGTRNSRWILGSLWINLNRESILINHNKSSIQYIINNKNYLLTKSITHYRTVMKFYPNIKWLGLYKLTSNICNYCYKVPNHLLGQFSIWHSVCPFMERNKKIFINISVAKVWLKSI